MSKDTEGIMCPHCKCFIPNSYLDNDIESLPPYHKCGENRVYTSDGHSGWECSNCRTFNSGRCGSCDGCGKGKDSNMYDCHADPSKAEIYEGCRHPHKPGRNAEFPGPPIYMNGTTRPW